MSVNLYIDSTILESAKKMINTIDNSDFFIENIIVVPDKFSLQMEKLILNTLPNKSFFNVSVVGLTELTQNILQDEQQNILTSGESLLLTQKAIENVRKDLLVLNKTNINFCYEINKILMQLKSSLIKGDDLNVNASGLAGIKFHDLKLIFNEYERLRDKHDANSRLSLASEKLKNSSVFQNTKVYFAGFDAFTKEAYSLLSALVTSAKEVNVSLAKASNIGNDYIYEKDISQKLINIALENGIEYKVVENKEKYFPQKQAIIDGVYSFDKVKCKNERFYNLFSAGSLSEEVEGVAKIIYDHIVRGYRYSDIAVMVSDVQKYENIIESVFESFDIPYFIDSSVCGDQTILAKTIFNFFNVVVSHYSSQSLKNLFSDILLGKNEELIEKVGFYQVDNKAKYKKYIAKENPYNDFLTEIEKCKNAKEYGSIATKILNALEEKFTQLLQDLDQRAYLKEKNINLQAIELIKESLGLINEYEGEISISEYVKKLKLLLSFKDVLTVPTFIDGVFVGDATTSSLLDSRVILILGGEKLPVINTDNGFLSDEELSLNFNDKQIQPTIRMINRRNRFKLFNLLTKAREKLIITYQVLNEEGKKNELPSYIASLNEIFDVAPIKMVEQFDFEIGNENKVWLGNRQSFVQSYYYLLDDKTRKELDIDDKKNIEINKKQISLDCKEVFFKNDRARVTQLEQYFSCPFKHFVNYGLGLKEKETCFFEVKDIGNICHRGAELFVKKLIKENFDLSISIKDFIDNNFVKILEDEKLYDKFILLSEKESLEKYLKNHLRVLLQDIIKEMSISKFRPKYLEKQFQSLKVGKDNITLVGKADRIDECGDYFRIIDYKTGHTGSILKELYYGNKLQLFLYQKVVKEELNKRSAGVFYFSAKFDYSKNEDEDKKLLKGLAENDKEVVSLLDNGVDVNGKSSILSINILKNGEYSGSAIAQKSLSEYECYAKKIADRAVDEICSGFIEAKPDSDACRWCPYASICMYEKTNGVRIKDKIGDFDCEG